MNQNYFLKNNYQLEGPGLAIFNESSMSVTDMQVCNDQIGKTQIFISLRGGGGICGSTKTSHQYRNLSSPFIIPSCFHSNFQKFSSTLINNIPIDGNDPDVLITFQWFIQLNYYFLFLNKQTMHNEQNFWIIACNQQLASSYYYPYLEKFEQILNILPKYLRAPGYLFYLLLKICNFLLQIIAKFQAHNEKRQIEHEKQESYKIQIKEIETQIEIESNRIWEQGVNFELQLIKTVITHLRKNSTQKQDMLFNFIIGLATQFTAFKVTVELKQSLQDGAKLIATIIYEEQIQNPIQIFKIYQYFQELKCQVFIQCWIIQKKVIQLTYQIKKIGWIEIISNLFLYRPIIAKDDFKQEEWNKLLRINLINCLSYSQNKGMININLVSDMLQLSGEIEKKLNVDDIELIAFKKSLLELSLQNNQELMLWNQFLDFEFKKKKFKAKFIRKIINNKTIKKRKNIYKINNPNNFSSQYQQ